MGRSSGPSGSSHLGKDTPSPFGSNGFTGRNQSGLRVRCQHNPKHDLYPQLIHGCPPSFHQPRCPKPPSTCSRFSILLPHSRPLNYVPAPRHPGCRDSPCWSSCPTSTKSNSPSPKMASMAVMLLQANGTWVNLRLQPVQGPLGIPATWAPAGHIERWPSLRRFSPLSRPQAFEHQEGHQISDLQVFLPQDLTGSMRPAFQTSLSRPVILPRHNTNSGREVAIPMN